MAGAGKKTFTAGEVLTASDVNTYLMEQSVMYFAGTAARSSAIPTPSTGMTTYIGTTGTASIPQLEVYTGSAFQTPYGSTLLANASFTGAATVTIDNVFSTRYDSYQFVLNCKNASTNDVALSMQFRSGGATIGGTAYTNNKIQSYGTFIGASTTTSTANWQLGNTSQNNYSQVFATISNAALALPKTINFTMAHGQSTVNIDSYTGYGINITSTAYDGLIFTTVGTMTGTCRIYGLRNS